MEYHYDIFISYRRRDKWPEWVKAHLVLLLTRYLNDELEWDVRIFFDQDIEMTNVTWPIALATNLAHSAILIPLWSRSYFRSEWCVAELDHMYHREKRYGFREVGNPRGLIVPAIIHDGEEHLPTEVRSIQSVKLQDYALVHLQDGTKDAASLEKLIREWAPEIAKCIQSAPPYDGDWDQPISDDFMSIFLS